MYKLTLILLLALSACHPDYPPKKVTVHATIQPGYGHSFDVQLHFSKPVVSSAVVTFQYIKNIADLPGVYGAGQSFLVTEVRQYNADSTTSQVINSMENYNVESICGFEILSITEQDKYQFVIDNSMHQPCPLTR